MTILAGCMAALGLFVLLLMFGILIADAREHNRKRGDILRELKEHTPTGGIPPHPWPPPGIQRKEETDGQH